jgi:hypothetical protein
LFIIYILIYILIEQMIYHYARAGQPPPVNIFCLVNNLFIFPG